MGERTIAVDSRSRIAQMMSPTVISATVTSATVICATVLALSLGGSPAALFGAGRPGSDGPDLTLAWVERGVEISGSRRLEGDQGSVLTLICRVKNVGGSDASAVVLSARTALGAVGDAKTLEPGPAVGAELDHTLRLELRAGMREICVDAELQGRSSTDPREANLADNRLCRRLEVHK